MIQIWIEIDTFYYKYQRQHNLQVKLFFYAGSNWRSVILNIYWLILFDCVSSSVGGFYLRKTNSAFIDYDGDDLCKRVSITVLALGLFNGVDENCILYFGISRTANKSWPYTVRRANYHDWYTVFLKTFNASEKNSISFTTTLIYFNGTHKTRQKFKYPNI